ncbi:putative phage-like protein [Salinisphaera hydrothermalis C41B8]|uniref:Putative phage-like protein n=2 Tax=Salinisphaera TaxID=180541 RepID=A0A084IQU9_SALHC|nr:putative phage-like protein [Salinisphaera hydrothermalis C41B8]
MFDRYSDGMIQAAILRSAKPEELRYDLSEEMSSEMAAFLCLSLKHCDSHQGEAILEFLFAIATNRLTLRQKHFDALKEAASYAPIYSDLFGALLSNPRGN